MTISPLLTRPTVPKRVQLSCLVDAQFYDQLELYRQQHGHRSVAEAARHLLADAIARADF